MQSVLWGLILKNSHIQIILASLIFVSLGLFVSLILFTKSSPAETPQSSPLVLSETRTAVVLSPTPTPTASPSPSPTPAPSLKPKPNKDFYIVAAFGDSMVDTMGENLDYLDKAMMARYPTTKFKFYNYGIGSQNVVEANGRFESHFNNKTRDYDPINKINADVIIISSFAYNPLYPYDKNSYINALRDVINKAKATKAQVYLLAEIAPLRTGFGKGPGGVNWDQAKTAEHVGFILQNLDAAISLSKETNTPLINAYGESQVDGKYGDRTYVSSHDGIHPSIEGEIFMANIIAETIALP